MEQFKDDKNNEKENGKGNEKQEDKAKIRNSSRSESIKGFESINLKVAEKKESVKNILEEHGIGNSSKNENAIASKKKDQEAVPVKKN